jgi:hypothetical protein
VEDAGGGFEMAESPPSQGTMAASDALGLCGVQRASVKETDAAVVRRKSQERLTIGRLVADGRARRGVPLWALSDGGYHDIATLGHG